MLQEDGSVWAWGSNGYGEVGTGNNVEVQSPVQVLKQNGEYLTDVIAIGSSNQYSIALCENGDVYQWGCLYYSVYYEYDFCDINYRATQIQKLKR